MKPPSGAPGLIDGQQLRDAFVLAAQHLRDVARAIDGINVYPVPDGDTGSNMAATMREAIDSALLVGASPAVAAVLEAIARGALYGARGNSGVILSQALRGFGVGAGEAERFDAAALARGLEEAATEAYAAVSKPQEGTMLTVMRAAAGAAAAAASGLREGGAGHPCAGILAEAIKAAEEAEARTIEQLEELREAGVPDAGGEGVCVILRGLHAAITGTVPPAPAIPERPIAMLPGHESEQYGYCTEFLIEQESRPIELEEVRGAVSAGDARSVVVVGDERFVRVHVHTGDPHGMLERAVTFGRVVRPKIEDMGAQRARWERTGTGAGARTGLLALSRGRGFDEIFRSLGASVTDLGEVVKPPAGEIAAAADAMGVPDVIVLPNHRNVVLAAHQAAGLTRCTLHVVETATLPQGIAAAIAFNRDEGVAGNMPAMAAARSSVCTVEVTWAAANRVSDGVAVSAGQAIALVDGKLVKAAQSDTDALLAGLEAAGADRAALVTIYAGEGVGEERLALATTAARRAFAEPEIERVSGGQPLYTFIASVEA
ncbi:MAG: DAK2 domain-containing protein [Dehalococcoidia bacterium]|nr:DAK2 domain-containing protein [Dehalococcoidia bacterium]